MTGVQTCALPIWAEKMVMTGKWEREVLRNQCFFFWGCIKEKMEKDGDEGNYLVLHAFLWDKNNNI